MTTENQQPVNGGKSHIKCCWRVADLCCVDFSSHPYVQYVGWETGLEPDTETPPASPHLLFVFLVYLVQPNEIRVCFILRDCSGIPIYLRTLSVKRLLSSGQLPGIITQQLPQFIGMHRYTTHTFHLSMASMDENKLLFANTSPEVMLEK